MIILLAILNKNSGYRIKLLKLDFSEQILNVVRGNSLTYLEGALELNSRNRGIVERKIKSEIRRPSSILRFHMHLRKYI